MQNFFKTPNLKFIFQAHISLLKTRTQSRQNKITGTVIEKQQSNH
jgi:hypothetical protein